MFLNKVAPAYWRARRAKRGRAILRADGRTLSRRGPGGRNHKRGRWWLVNSKRRNHQRSSHLGSGLLLALRHCSQNNRNDASTARKCRRMATFSVTVIGLAVEEKLWIR